MEPDVHVLAGAQTRVQGAHAGDHAMGPGQSPRGGERVPGRGERETHTVLKICLNIYSI